MHQGLLMLLLSPERGVFMLLSSLIYLKLFERGVSRMKHRKILASLLALILTLSLFAGCGKTTQPAPKESPATPAIMVTDMAGREITLERPATRIVALTAADCEILYAIGADDALIGRGEYCDYPAEVLDVPSVQSGYDTNLEQIIALEPQVVLMSTMAQSEEQITALEKAGIKVVVSDAQDIAGVYTAIEMIGRLMGKDAEAYALIDSMKNTFAEVSAKAGDGTKTVYFEVSPLEYGLWTAGADTFMNEVCEMLGLKNAFSDVSGWGEISEEQVLERNPDYIVTINMYWGDGLTPVEEIMARDGWKNVTAVQNGAILNLQNNELSRPGPRLADGAQLMFDFICSAETSSPAA
jgi:iron complex transport system substrate-binding protein